MMFLSLCLFGLVPMANIESHVIHDESPQALGLNNNNQTMIGLNVSDFDLVCIDDDAEKMESMAMDPSSSPIVNGNDDQESTQSYSIAEIVSVVNAAAMDFRSGMSLKFSHFTESTQAFFQDMTAARVYAKLKYLVLPKPQPVTLKSLAKEAFDRTLWEFQRVHDWCLARYQDMFPPPPPPSFWEEPTTVSFKQLRVTISGVFGPSLPPPPRTFGAIARDCWKLFSAWYEENHELLIGGFILLALICVGVASAAYVLYCLWEDCWQEKEEEEPRSNNREEPRPNREAPRPNVDPAWEQRMRWEQQMLPIVLSLIFLGLTFDDFADCQNSQDERGVLRRAWRRESIKYHPDQGGSNEAFHNFTDRYQILVDHINDGNTLKMT